ncbi:MAG: type IV pilus biogenesis/stability protein PilW [Woeseiaceae bacterium]
MSDGASAVTGVAMAALLIFSGCVSSTSGPPKSDPDDSDAADLNYQLGARYYKNGEYDLSRDRLLLSLELNPNNAIAWTTLGLTYEALGNLRLAEDAYGNAVRVAPRDYKIQDNYAVFLCRNGRQDEARKYFDKAIKAPTNDYAERTYTNAGVCMMQKPDYDQAERYFRGALERRPNHAEALLQMSVLFYEKDDYLRARAFLQRYLSSNPVSPGILYHGIQIEQQLADDTARREYTVQLLRDYPNSPEAQKIRQSN